MPRKALDPHVADGFLDLFGRPTRESRASAKRRNGVRLPQALNLSMARPSRTRWRIPKGRVAKMVLAARRTARSRKSCICDAVETPNKAEAERGGEYLSGGAKAMRAQDILWAF